MVLDGENYVCDGDECGATVEIKTEADLLLFESDWYSGLTLDLCPACEVTEKGRELIATDKSAMTAIRSEVVFIGEKS